MLYSKNTNCSVAKADRNLALMNIDRDLYGRGAETVFGEEAGTRSWKELAIDLLGRRVTGTGSFLHCDSYNYDIYGRVSSTKYLLSSWRNRESLLHADDTHLTHWPPLLLPRGRFLSYQADSHIFGVDSHNRNIQETRRSLQRRGRKLSRGLFALAPERNVTTDCPSKTLTWSADGKLGTSGSASSHSNDDNRSAGSGEKLRGLLSSTMTTIMNKSVCGVELKAQTDTGSESAWFQKSIHENTYDEELATVDRIPNDHLHQSLWIVCPVKNCFRLQIVSGCKLCPGH